MAPSAIIAVLKHFFLAWPIWVGEDRISDRLEVIAAICAIIGMLIVLGVAVVRFAQEIGYHLPIF